MTDSMKGPEAGQAQSQDPNAHNRPSEGAPVSKNPADIARKGIKDRFLGLFSGKDRGNNSTQPKPLSPELQLAGAAAFGGHISPSNENTNIMQATVARPPIGQPPREGGRGKSTDREEDDGVQDPGRRRLLKIGIGAAAAAATSTVVAKLILPGLAGDGPVQPKPTPGTGGNETATPGNQPDNTPTPPKKPENTPLPDRTPMQPKRIEIPQETLNIMRKEISHAEDLEIYEAFQGEYLQFAIAGNAGLATRTKENTEMGIAEAKGRPVDTLSSIQVTDEYLTEITGQKMPEAELVKRLENVFMLDLIAKIRQDGELAGLLPEYHKETDPYDEQALTAFKELLRTRKEPQKINGYKVNIEQPQLWMFTKDFPGRAISTGFGWAEQYFPDGGMEGSRVLKMWFQEGLFNKESWLTTGVDNLVAGGHFTREQAIDRVNLYHPWTIAITERIDAPLTASMNPEIATTHEMGSPLSPEQVEKSTLDANKISHQLAIADTQPTAISLFKVTN